MGAGRGQDCCEQQCTGYGVVGQDSFSNSSKVSGGA